MFKAGYFFKKNIKKQIKYRKLKIFSYNLKKKMTFQLSFLKKNIKNFALITKVFLLAPHFKNLFYTFRKLNGQLNTTEYYLKMPIVDSLFKYRSRFRFIN